jgi:amino acid adenylation domain-containing protein/non-ribosomal peptide synthase protein (TIGR01720 family)
VESHGREPLFDDLDLTRTVGWFTAIYPVRVGARRRVVPNGGVGYGVLRYLGRYDGLESSARIKFNYLGRLDNVSGISSETRDDDVSPRNIRSHPIEITAIVLDGRLRIAWEYSPHLDRREEVEALAERFTDALRKGETACPLSPMQQGMLFETLRAPESSVYLEQMSVRLDGALDVERFQQAWRDVVARYDALRAEFRWQGVDEPEQILRAEVELPWVKRDLDLTRAPLMWFELTQLAGNAWEFTWTYHHLLLDGWSRHRVVKDVVDLYAGNPLAPAPPPYRGYIDWLRRQDPAAAEAFWRDALESFSAPTPLTVDLPGPPSGTAVRYEFAVVGRRLPGLTLNTLVQGAWALLLSRYSGQDDIVFGATVSGRPATLPGVEEMVGLFINTIPVRVAIDEDQPLVPWLAALQERQVEADAFSWCSLIDIQSWSGVPRGLPLFESIVVFENYPAKEISISAGGVTMSQARAFEQTNYPIVLVAAPGESLHLALEYDPGRFDAATVRRMAGHLQTILSAMTSGAAERLADLPLLTRAESRQLLVEWNSRAADYPHAAGKCAHELFAEQAARTPDAIAVVSDKGSLTFDGLNRRANQLAHYLIRHGVGPETVVGVSMERSIEVIVSCLAVWKAGGAYVPLDPSYPKDRLAFMIEDSGAAMVIRELPPIDGERDENPPPRAAPDNLAYLIYTSGSTGKPKGVLIEHLSLVDHCCTMIGVYAHTPESRVLLFVPLSFDQSVEDIFPTLLAGARLVLPRPGPPPSIGELLALIEQEGVTMLHMPTAYWHEWTSVLGQFPLPDCLQRVKVGGEVAPLEPLRVFLRDARPGALFANGYGPTETTVTSHFYDSGDAIDPTSASVPIGRTLPNTLTYVLDRRGRPAPVGVPGELFIGGVRVGRGYKDRPELTAERFLPNPFGPGRVYRTGDSVRYLPDGNLEFLGRIDQQVKIRGFRIELGEIEALLNRHPAVRIAAVAARADQVSQMLVAYVCPSGERVPDSELAAFVAERLPDYMVPSAYVWLDAMPVNPSGKIDRKALPAPQLPAIRAASAPPRDALEQRLAAIWSEVLGRDVGIDDNFFECGGHSLIAIRLVARIEQATNRSLPLSILFDRPTVAGIAEHLRRSGAADDWSPLVAIQTRGSRPPFFCVHGGGGNVLHYYGLSRALGADQPFYALQAAGLDGRSEPLQTVEAMAELYVRAIRTVQPHGPYWLGGHSLGGQIAYEMAQQLRRAGEEVALVAVMDTFAPGGRAGTIGEGWDDARWMRELVDMIERFLDVRLGLAREGLQLESVAEALRSLGVLPPGAGTDLLRGLFRVFQANNRADYAPAPPSNLGNLPIVLFRGADSSDSGVHPSLRADPAWGWNAFSSRPVEVVFVPGDHIGMMTRENVRELAHRLGGLLAREIEGQLA